jgi:hypothetical protein
MVYQTRLETGSDFIVEGVSKVLSPPFRKLAWQFQLSGKWQTIAANGIFVLFENQPSSLVHPENRLKWTELEHEWRGI